MSSGKSVDFFVLIFFCFKENINKLKLLKINIAILQKIL